MNDTAPDTPAYTPAPVTRRVVLRHPSGLHQILAATEQQPEAFGVVTIAGKLTPLNLVAVKRSHYLFTVAAKPEGLGSFHPEQQ